MHSMINDGVDGNKAVVMAVIHTIVGVGVGLLLAELGATGIILILGSLAVSWTFNLIIDLFMKV